MNLQTLKNNHHSIENYTSDLIELTFDLGDSIEADFWEKSAQKLLNDRNIEANIDILYDEIYDEEDLGEWTIGNVQIYFKNNKELEIIDNIISELEKL